MLLVEWHTEYTTFFFTPKPTVEQGYPSPSFVRGFVSFLIHEHTTYRYNQTIQQQSDVI